MVPLPTTHHRPQVNVRHVLEVPDTSITGSAVLVRKYKYKYWYKSTGGSSTKRVSIADVEKKDSVCKFRKSDFVSASLKKNVKKSIADEARTCRLMGDNLKNKE
jgi:hypothetical protein